MNECNRMKNHELKNANGGGYRNFRALEKSGAHFQARHGGDVLKFSLEVYIYIQPRASYKNITRS